MNIRRSEPTHAPRDGSAPGPAPRRRSARGPDDGTVRRAARHRVVLVREWEQQLSSSGCCGRIEGDFLDFAPAPDAAPDAAPTAEEAAEEEGRRARAFPGRRAEMERAGELYRAVRARYGSRVEVRIVDPRNLLSLLPTVVRDARRRGAGPLELLRSLLRLSVNCVVVDGRVVARNRWPRPEELFRAVEGEAPTGGL